MGIGLRRENGEGNTKEQKMKTSFTSAFMNSGAVSLDIHAPVRGVRFGQIISFVVDNHSDTIAVTDASGAFDPAAHDVAWEREFAPRMVAMTLTEKTLLTAAMMGTSRSRGNNWDGWQNWGAEQRAAAAQELMETVTLLYVVHDYFSRYGQQRLEPYQDILVKMVQDARFCA